MGQIKMGIKMLRYTFGIRISLVCMGVFLGIGMFEYLLPIQSMSMMLGGIGGGFFILVSGMWLVQMLSSLGASDMVKASPWRRAIETSIPAMINFLCSLVLYMLTVALSALRFRGATGEERQILVKGLLTNGALAFLLMVYIGMAYKCFISATVGFFAAICLLQIVSAIISVMGKFPDLSFTGAAVIGVLCVIAGALAEYGASLLLYKLPVSKRAQMHGLQKYM